MKTERRDISDVANGTKEDVKRGILHRSKGYYVTNEGTRTIPNFHVWMPNIIHSVCDSAYTDISIAVSRCNYLAKNNITMKYNWRY